jgi:predicted transcriptional regulator
VASSIVPFVVGRVGGLAPDGIRAQEGAARPAILRIDASLEMSTTRKRIFQFIAENPGSTIQLVAASMRLSHTTASHHLATMCREGLLIREKEGRSVRHYSPQKESRDSRLHPFLADGRCRRAIDYLVAQPAVQRTVNEMATSLDLNHGYLLRALRNLDKHGFVRLIHPHTRYYVQPTTRLVDLMKRHNEILEDGPRARAADSGIALPHDAPILQ